jgi:xylulokinase
MHGVVLISRDGGTPDPAIIWADQRTAGDIDALIGLVGAETFARVAGTAPAAGFMATTLYWLLHHAPERLDRARMVLLPKDTVRWRLTQTLGTDVSDASATALFDIRARRWSEPIIGALGLPSHLWPPVNASADVVGTLTAEAAKMLGLPSGIPVVAGCADQPAQAIGGGLIDPGIGSITIGTGGQIFVPLSAPQFDPALRLHTFCHAAPDRWYLLGAMLSAGLSLRWLRGITGLNGDPHAYEKLSALADTVAPGSDGLLFLPYLVGERAPIRDAGATGCFSGLTLQHGVGHLARAVMEGVAFNLRQIIEAMGALPVPIAQWVASGGGLSSGVWRQIVADVLAQPLTLSTRPERAGVGAALIAGLGIGIYSGYADLQALERESPATTVPDLARSRLYADQYERFIGLYPSVRPLMNG